MVERDIEYVQAKLRWMEANEIWPNGLRYLWTDAFGLVLYLTLYDLTGEESYRDRAAALVDEVYRVLGRPRGLRIGEAEDRDGQYYHYLAMWLFALYRFGQFDASYREEGLRLAREIHDAFVLPGIGVIWKMQEDLSAPYPGYGLGAIDAYNGYVAYRLLDSDALGAEIADMRGLIEGSYRELDIDQDLGLGMMLWLAHFFPEEDWARYQTRASLIHLERLWIDPPGYFCRQRGWRDMRFAFTNYGVSLGLQAAGRWPDKVDTVNRYFDSYRSGDEYDLEAITHVMACTSRLPGLMLARPLQET